jgi:hypothetical protein
MMSFNQLFPLVRIEYSLLKTFVVWRSALLAGWDYLKTTKSETIRSVLFSQIGKSKEAWVCVER